MRRRNFLGWTFLGIIISYLNKSWHTPSQVRAITEDDREFTYVGTITQLKQEGQILDEESEVGAVLVMLAPDNYIVAVDPTCTHAGCTVDWEEPENSFICPCHGSKFTLQGDVIEGLANFPLQNYEVKTKGDKILVKPVPINREFGEMS